MGLGLYQGYIGKFHRVFGVEGSGFKIQELPDRNPDYKKLEHADPKPYTLNTK